MGPLTALKGFQIRTSVKVALHEVYTIRNEMHLCFEIINEKKDIKFIITFLLRKACFVIIISR